MTVELTPRPISPVVESPNPLTHVRELFESGHVEHALHAVNNPLSIGAALVGATMPLQAVPTAVYFASHKLLEHTPRGDGIATNIGFGVEGIVSGLFEEKGLLRARAERVAPFAVNAAAHGSRLLTAVGKSAAVLGKTVSAAVAIEGVLVARRAVVEGGGDAGALVTTHAGREGVLRAVGGMLLLTPSPVLALAGAGVFLLAAANDGNFLRFLDAAPHDVTTHV